MGCIVSKDGTTYILPHAMISDCHRVQISGDTWVHWCFDEAHGLDTFISTASRFVAVTCKPFTFDHANMTHL
jgi:hypothetical protein